VARLRQLNPTRVFATLTRRWLALIAACADLSRYKERIVGKPGLAEMTIAVFSGARPWRQGSNECGLPLSAGFRMRQ